MRQRQQALKNSDISTEFPDWAQQLRSGVVTDIEPTKVAALAELASVTAAASTASLAIAAGTTAGVLTGAKSMTSVFTGVLAKAAASAVVAATLTGGGAIAGILPDTMQSTVANAADNVGLDLPRPDTRLDVDGSGEIVFEMVDGVLTVVGIEGNSQWEAQIRSQTDTSAVVDFVSETQTKTVTLATNTVGEVETMIETASNSELKTELGADTSADASIESGSNSNGANTDAGGSADTSGGLKTGDTEVDVGLNADVRIGAGAND